MAKTTLDHMKGINSLPKWDPQNPTKYNYTPGDYDPQDYAKFKAARLEANPIASKANPFGPQGTLSKQINKSIKDNMPATKKPSTSQIKAAAKAGKELIADVDSTCFDELSWQDGVVYATFQNGYQYDAPLDLETFLEWPNDSLGQYFNQVLGQDFFA